MPDVEIPSYVDLLRPTLVAINLLGGSATKDEIDQSVPELLSLTSEQMDLSFDDEAAQTGSKVIHRLAWARTYLKKFGALDNSTRGVWTLASAGHKFLTMKQEEAEHALREQDREVRRQYRELRKQEGEKAVEGEAPDDEGGALAGPESDWKTELLVLLREMPVDAFERLCGRLLREVGFTKVEVLGRSGDGGIDGRGLLELGGLLTMPVFFQAKRYKDSVRPGEVRDFRGAMSGRGDKGLLITTGTFTPEAKKEATRDGAPPIDLIDGERLCDKIRDAGIGVMVEMAPVVHVDDGYFKSV